MIADSYTHNAICGAGRGDHLHMRVVDCMYDVDARLHMADAKRKRQQQPYCLQRRHIWPAKGRVVTTTKRKK